MMKLSQKLLIGMLSVLPLSVFAQIQNITIDGDHGKLAAMMQTPDIKGSYPMVIIMHGFTSDKDFVLLEQIASSLEKNGIASIRFDFNGHGMSEGKFEEMTVANEITDARKVYEYAKNLPNVSSISLSGHSQGGVVASMLSGQLGSENIKSVALLAPAAVLRDDALRGQIFDVKYDAINPPKEVDLNDPYHKGYKIGYEYIKTALTMPIFETAAKYDGAVCIIHGSHDTIVPYTYSERYNSTYKNSRLVMIDKADHAFTAHFAEVVKTATDFFTKEVKK